MPAPHPTARWLSTRLNAGEVVNRHIFMKEMTLEKVVFMAEPTNYREASCCRNCKHCIEVAVVKMSRTLGTHDVCKKNDELPISPDYVCDDWSGNSGFHDMEDPRWCIGSTKKANENAIRSRFNGKYEALK